jgi:hypothetical protein
LGNHQENRTFHDNEGFWAIQEGEAEGTIIGGNHFVLNMLQGTSYFPPLREAILFLGLGAAANCMRAKVKRPSRSRPTKASNMPPDFRSSEPRHRALAAGVAPPDPGG